MAEVILITQGGDEFFVYAAKKSSPTAPRFVLRTKSGNNRVKFVMTVRDSGIVINRESGDPADNVGNNRVTGFRIHGSRKGSWSLGRSD
jgi:hypothetical protein